MEITDDKLLKIALITSLIGLIGLIIFTPSIEVKKVEIQDINRGMIDEEVSIDCVVSDVKASASKSSYFLTINDGTGQMSLIIFESQLAQLKDNGIAVESYCCRNSYRIQFPAGTYPIKRRCNKNCLTQAFKIS